MSRSHWRDRTTSRHHSPSGGREWANESVGKKLKPDGGRFKSLNPMYWSLKNFKRNMSRRQTTEHWRKNAERSDGDTSDRPIVLQTDRQSHRQITRIWSWFWQTTDRQTDRHRTKTKRPIDRSTDRQSVWRTDRHTDRERTNERSLSYRSLYWQTVSVTDRKIDSKTDRTKRTRRNKQTKESV